MGLKTYIGSSTPASVADFLTGANWTGGTPESGDTADVNYSVTCAGGGSIPENVIWRLAAGVTLDFGPGGGGNGDDSFVMGSGAHIRNINFGFADGSLTNFGSADDGQGGTYELGEVYTGTFNPDVFTPDTIQFDIAQGGGGFDVAVTITGTGRFSCIIPANADISMSLGTDTDVTLHDSTHVVAAYIDAGINFIAGTSSIPTVGGAFGTPYVSTNSTGQVVAGSFGTTAKDEMTTQLNANGLTAAWTADVDAQATSAATNALTAATHAATLVSRISATLFSGITSIGNWLRAMTRSSVPDATALSEINSGGGTFASTSHSLQAAAAAIAISSDTHPIVVPIVTRVGEETFLTTVGGVEKALTVFQNSKASFKWRVNDQTSQPVDLTDHEFRFNVHGKGSDEILFSIEDAEQFVLGYSDPDDTDTLDEVTVTLLPADLTGYGGWEYKFWDLTLDTVLGSGQLASRLAPRTPPP